jgi:hypothetical protein
MISFQVNDRRMFLKALGTAGWVALIGTSMAGEVMLCPLTAGVALELSINTGLPHG